MVKEFRDFLLRGNVVDLAVAVVIGAAFAAIVDSFVADIITPLLGIFGVPDFATWTVSVGDAVMKPGVFLNTVISFVLIGAVIFFLVVKPMNAINARRAKEEEDAAEPTEAELLGDILAELKKSNNQK